jgi:hypothetical protein
VITIPSGATIFSKDGLQAAVSENGMVHLRRLDLSADNGATVEVRGGLHAGEQLILNPPIGVTDGMRVTSAQEQIS